MAAAMLIFQVGIFIRALRWWALLAALGPPHGLMRLVWLYYSGAFFNTFLPTGFGGDVVRAVEIGQDTDANVAIATVALDRLSGLAVLFIIALGALPFSLSILPGHLTLLIIAVCVAGLAGWVLLLHTRVVVGILEWVDSLLKVVDLSRLVAIAETIRTLSRKAVRRAVLASFVFDLLLIGTQYVLSLAFDLGVPVLVFALFTPLSSLLLLLPSIQGLGVREPALTLLLGSVGVPPEQAVAFAVGVYSLTLSTGLVGAVYYAIYSLASVAQRRAGATPGAEVEDAGR
ncbi:MAG: lysylphosphatidylglycerol synthase transmembrane domain-containing protein [Chloroflexota bacterium]